ncbi:MAG: GNAT family N-acetyltransferase [Stackebrandtia sp.]
MSVRILSESFDSKVARSLNEALQDEYRKRYDDVDRTPLAARDFTPPGGGYFVAYDGDAAVGSGAWRSHGESDAEMKRLYVVEAARGRGVAREMVTFLEADAAARGRARMILVTGLEQPEAIALYASMGYGPVEPFGLYAGMPLARHLGKVLSAARGD